MSQPQRCLRSASRYGCGLRTYGHQAEPPGQLVCIQWVSIAYFPIFPVRRTRCRYLGETQRDRSGADPEHQFAIIEPLGFSLTAVCSTYISAIAAFVVVFGPLGIMFWRVLNQQPTLLDAIIGIATLIWPVA